LDLRKLERDHLLATDNTDFIHGFRSRVS
jgi:hypothetical protein